MVIRRRPMLASKFWKISMSDFPGLERAACQEGMCSKSSGPLAGRLGAPRTAKAPRISRSAVKSRCAHEWDGWGRLSDDGPGHYNPDLSEGPWGRRSTPPHGGAQSSPQARLRAVPSMWATKCTKDGRKLDDDQRMPGAGLSCSDVQEGSV